MTDAVKVLRPEKMPIELEEHEVASLHEDVGGLLRSWGVNGDGPLSDTFTIVLDAVQRQRRVEQQRSEQLKLV